jgi:hypothetical protein
MRNLKLVDAVIALHEIRRTIEEECGECELSNTIARCAEDVHQLSLQDAKNVVAVKDIINKAKE